MKYYWLNRNTDYNKKIILFFAGFGMDETPFLDKVDKYNNNYDIVIFYDYNTLNTNFDFNKIFDNYNEINIISWSMGVFISDLILDKFKKNVKLLNCIAINGTLKPIDDHFGINKKIYDLTYKNFDISGRDNFYERMCRKKEILDDFLLKKPNRKIEDQKKELLSIKNYFTKSAENSNAKSATIFKTVIIGNDDKIFSTKNQIRFWEEYNSNNKEKIEINLVDSPHYFRFDSFEELIKDYIDNGKVILK